mgnify:FL=1
MLFPFQPLGSRPPLFLVHGLYGIFAFSRSLAEILGPDQPIYGIHARGFRDTESPCDTVAEMADAYLREIQGVCAAGPYFIGGICHGSLVAIEIARKLRANGQPFGRLFLLDPGVSPHRSAAGLNQLESGLTRAGVRQQLADQARASVIQHSKGTISPPFDADDPRQTTRATHVAMTTALAFARHRVEPFDAPCELFVSSDWGIHLFVPGHEWQRVLRGHRRIHVFHGLHTELLGLHHRRTARLVKAALESCLPAPWRPDRRA